MTLPPLPWIEYSEKVVGANHPTLDDVANRPLRELVTQSGYDPDEAPFKGLYGPVYNVKAAGAKGDGVTDDEPAIQALLDYICGTLRPEMAAPVYFPCGIYRIGKPLRVKRNYVRLIGAGQDGSVVIGEGHGPLLAIYPARGKYFDEVGYEAIEDTEVIQPALVTGSGSSFLMTYVPPTDPLRYFNLRDTAAVELDGLASFCAEATINLDDVGGGSILQSMGALFFGEEVFTPGGGEPDWAFRLSVQSGAKLRGDMTIGGVKYQVDGTTTLLVDTNYHIAIDYDGSNIRLFVNGNLEDTQAATGTVTQMPWEDVTFGVGFGQWPELGYYQQPVQGRIDAIRLSSTSRYTGAFSAPTVKWSNTLASNTLIILNFDEQFDYFTVGRTPTGDAYLFMRNSAFLALSQTVTIENLFFNGVFLDGTGPPYWPESFSFDGHRGGIIANQAPQLLLSHNTIWCKGFGIKLLYNCFLSKLDKTKVVCYAPTNMALGMLIANGVTHLEAMELTGGMVQLAAGSNTFSATVLWLESSSETFANMFYNQRGGTGNFSLSNPVFNAESGGESLIACLVAGQGGINIHGGTFEHARVPAMMINEGRVTCVGTDFYSSSITDDPVVQVNISPPQPVHLIACNKFVDGGGIPSSIHPWVDSDHEADVVLIGNHRTKPLVEGCLITTPVDNEVVIDVALTNKFTIRGVDEEVDFSINSPLHGLAGQEITVTVINENGLGVITWGGLYFMDSWTNPEVGFARSKTFRSDGLGWLQISGTDDVPVPLYTPDLFSDLAAWYDAEQLSLSDTDPVATWPDASGNGNDLVQGTGGNQPLFAASEQNGKPAVVFDGTDDFMFRATPKPDLDFATEHSIFVVMKIRVAPTVPNSFQVFQTGNSGGSGMKCFVAFTRGLGARYDDDNGLVLGFQEETDVMANDVYYLKEIFYKDQTYTLYSNGVLKDTVISSGGGEPNIAAADDFFVGAENNGNSPLDGAIAEMAFFQRKLTDDEKSKLENYFARKYALDIGLACE